MSIIEDLTQMKLTTFCIRKFLIVIIVALALLGYHVNVPKTKFGLFGASQRVVIKNDIV